MNSIKVSVIIPNYNHARYLDQRIQSILNQTYQDYEVIILDDCSTDNSCDVISKYRDNPHISQIIVNENNSGSTFKQWDKGIRLAKGEIIWIAESDDYCEPNFLEEMIKQWDCNPNCAIIQSSCFFVDEHGLPCVNLNKKYTGQSIFLKGDEAIKKHLIYGGSYINNASAATFRKDIAKDIPSDYMDYKASGDRLFWIHMLEKGDICTVDKPLNYYRQHIKNVSFSKEKDGTQCRENYRINRYLHEKKYISGRLRDNELAFFWEYIHTYDFYDEDVRKSLIQLWFPGIKRYKLIYRIRRKIYSWSK